MEISFEKGKFVYCPGGFNYQEVLDDFKRAKKVRIITYNISGTGNTDPLLEQIKKLGEDVDVQIITNIPSRFETYYSSAAGEAMRSRAKHNIEVYLKKLNPESFPTAFSISFNFFNHAKIISQKHFSRDKAPRTLNIPFTSIHKRLRVYTIVAFSFVHP